MGTNQSKTDSDNLYNRTDTRRNSKRRMSKSENIDSIVTYLQILKSEILQYNGFREDDRYKEFQKSLANNAQEIQRLSSSKKDQKKIDRAQKEINSCIRLLEQKIIENEKRLDVAAVESHSFINENLKSNNTNNKRNVKQAQITKSFNTLENVERQMNELQEEINRTINMDYNKKMLVVLEKKIHLLYTDLEMITADLHTPLHERKEYIGRQLIKYNNKVKRAKNTKSTTSKEEQQSINSKELLREIQNELKALGVQVTTFSDTKSSVTFQKIKNNLNSCWTQLQDIKNEENSLKKLKLSLTEKVKYTLNLLKEEANRNDLKLEIDKNKLKNIKSDVESYKMLEKQENFEDILKLLADRVKNIADFEVLQKDKEQLLEDLEDLHRKYQREKESAEKVVKQEVTENDKAKTIFKQLYNSIEDLTNLKDDEPIVEVLEAFRDNLNEKLKVLKKDNQVEPIYATPFSTNIKEGKMILSSALVNSLDNILHSVEVVETEYRPGIPEIVTVDRSKPIHSVMDVDVKVQELSKEIDNFSGKIADNYYKQINSSLQRCSMTLSGIDNENEGVLTAKREIQAQIDKIQENLDQKLKENEKNDVDDIESMKIILNDMKTIKKRIDCFNGLYKNALFKQIEDDLNLKERKLKEILTNVKHDKLKQIIEETLNKIKQYFKILDEKSIKITTDHGKNRQSITYDSYKQLEQVRNDLLTIKKEMETYNGTKREDDFNRICSKLMECNERLDSIVDMDSNSIKLSKDQYTNYIRELLKYFEEKTPTN